jgi:epoxyqueuosine reductase
MDWGGAVKRCALEAGFDLVGIAPPAAAQDLEFLPRWLTRGFAGEMRYLADPRRQDPRCVLPSVKSIICVGLVYNTTDPYSTGASAAGHARAWISRYAWGSDYHETMRGKLERLRSGLEALSPGVETRVYVDTGPVVERAFARLSGVGWMGKNTCLIHEQKGSWFFLGVILTNLELTVDVPAPDRCGSCTRCLEACPTGALVEPYVMDASRCISYFTIELKGSIPEGFRRAIGNNVFGCDICQDVCPWNGRPWSVVRGPLPAAMANPGSDASSASQLAATTAAPEFKPMEVQIHLREVAALGREGSEPATPDSQPVTLFGPALEALVSLTEEDFKRLFAHSPIRRAKYRGWLRNLCVAVGNSGDRRFIPWLESVARDADPMLREHAEWALDRLQSGV